MNYAILKTELTDDPLTRGYAAMSDQQAADSLNTANRSHLSDTLSSALLFENIDRTEFQALTAAMQSRVDRLLGLGEGIKVGPGSQARAELLAVFGGGSATAASLVAALTETVSRAQELGLPQLSAQMINNARTGAY